MTKRILIIGGGFGGVQTAQALRGATDLDVTLVTERGWLEYYGALYQQLRSDAIGTICMDLHDLLPSGVRIVIDPAKSIDLEKKVVTCASGHTEEYDVLVAAPGAEPAYFGIPGMQENSYTMRHVDDAMKLRRHVEALVPTLSSMTDAERAVAGRVVVIGAGPTGSETAAEIAVHARELLKAAGQSEDLLKVTILEAVDRVLPTLSPDVSARVKTRLEALGVEVLLQKKVTACEPGRLVLADGEILTKTVVWTAGVRARSILLETKGFTVDRRGRVEVDDLLRAKGVADVYVLGDSAVTQYSGMAQTAVYDGSVVGRILRGKSVTYRPSPPKFAIPIGPGWAAVSIGSIHVFGALGFLLRRAADLKVMLSLLPPLVAVRQFLGYASPRLRSMVSI